MDSLSVKEFISNQTVQAVLIVIAVGILLYFISKSCSEYFGNVSDYLPLVGSEQECTAEYPNVGSYSPDFNGASTSFQSTGNSRVVTPEDLVPKDVNGDLAGSMGDLSGKNFITSGFNIGINTVSSSLRNANYQLRSEPPNPIAQVSPWQQTTILPDFNQRSFELN